MTKERITSLITTFIPCFIFWLLLTMSLDSRELLGGVIICGLTAWFASGFYMKNNVDRMRFISPLRLLKMLHYVLFVFMGELLKANWEMAKIVLTGKPIKPAIIKVPVHGIKSYYGLAILADCITLTPGTITVDVAVEGGQYYMYVQWLIMESEDPEEAGEIIKGRMERWIGGIWG